jgi:flagellar hook-basal body complex protein FliE
MSMTAPIGSATSDIAGTSTAFETSSSKIGTQVPFDGLFQEAVGQIDSLETQARAAIDGLMTGNGVDVHQAMIATQKASMAFDLALALRNKAVQAYQSVMSMQF